MNACIYFIFTSLYMLYYEFMRAHFKRSRLKQELPSGGRALPGPARELRPLDPDLRQEAGRPAKNAGHPVPILAFKCVSRTARAPEGAQRTVP
jgi:hypothetical protein